MNLEAFTNALYEVETSVQGGLAGVATAALAVSGVIFGGLLLWAIFKAIANGKDIAASKSRDPEG